MAKPTRELARELVAHLEAAVELAYAAGRKAGMEEAANILHENWFRTQTEIESALRTRAAMEADK